jgi:hypothetical protein
MRGKRRILLVAAPVLLVAGLALVAQFMNYRAAQVDFHRLTREAQGPWPRSTVAQMVVVTLGSSAQGNPTSPEDLAAIGDRLGEVLEKTKVGHLDGSECHGTCRLFMYGSDANKLFETVEPVLQQVLPSGASVTMRLGPADARPLLIRQEIVRSAAQPGVEPAGASRRRLTP